MSARNHAGRKALLACGLLMTLLLPPQALADPYPARAVTVTVGYGAGDNMDLLVRMLAERAAKKLGQPIVVANKPGAAGAVELTTLAHEKPDGYQIGAVLDTALARLPVQHKLAYKLQDFEPVLQFSSGSAGIVVQASAPWKTLPDLIRYAKAHPGAVTYATTGPGSTMDVAFQFMKDKAGVDWIHVPYSTARQGLTAVLGGHVTAAVGTTQWVNEVRTGKLRLLAVLGEHRMKAFPEAPTIRELGYDFAADNASVLVAPRGTPRDILARLNDAFRQAMEDPEYLRLATSIQAEKVYRSGDELKPYLAQVQSDFAKTIADLRIPTDFTSAKSD
ncbi:tripartite tricarboxylate transporter substrate binding protein [Ramlibacter sp. G-1-2-2]|uniref:Tripartite tricarboxylate transporter substrate binding protein n=1 Tax=Ramlibacter agri TaxID=2728837 RepID=A0A848GVY1_9BURK|nr:tripartite tricarboxylate transporter substrate binding protein [Ramlibacter agri]NML42806.1 tripartite tricarboxylate transporter substrate binding protein [Ramlibacter agri]